MKLLRLIGYVVIIVALLNVCFGCIPEEDHMCLKCHGSGRVSGVFGPEPCPRCYGRGYLTY